MSDRNIKCNPNNTNEEKRASQENKSKSEGENDPYFTPKQYENLLMRRELENIPDNQIIEDSILSVGHVNVQCLRNKLIELEMFAYQQNLHLLCITEHWADETEINILNIPNYTLMSDYCRIHRKHGGVAIYIRNDIKGAFKPKNIKYIKSFASETTIELCAVSLCYKQTKINIIAIYRPPTGNFNMFVNNLSYALQVASKQNSVVVLCGDLNIDYLKESEEKNILRDTFDCFNLNMPLNEHPSRCNK